MIGTAAFGLVWGWLVAHRTYGTTVPWTAGWLWAGAIASAWTLAWFEAGRSGMLGFAAAALVSVAVYRSWCEHLSHKVMIEERENDRMDPGR